MHFSEDFFKILFLMLGVSIIIALSTIQYTMGDIMSERIDNVLLPRIKQEIEMKFFPS